MFISNNEVLNEILIVLKSLSKNVFIFSDLKPPIFLNDENEVVISDYLNNIFSPNIERLEIKISCIYHNNI